MIDKKHILHVQINIYTSFIEGKVSYKEPAIYETWHFYVLSRTFGFIVHCDRRLTNTSLLHHRRETQKNPKLTVQEAYACYYDRLKQTQRWIKSESRERTWSGLVLKKKKKTPKKLLF